MSLLIHPLGEASKIVPGVAPIFKLSLILSRGKIISGGRAYPEADHTQVMCGYGPSLLMLAPTPFFVLVLQAPLFVVCEPWRYQFIRVENYHWLAEYIQLCIYSSKFRKKSSTTWEVVHFALM